MLKIKSLSTAMARGETSAFFSLIPNILHGRLGRLSGTVGVDKCLVHQADAQMDQPDKTKRSQWALQEQCI